MEDIAHVSDTMLPRGHLPGHLLEVRGLRLSRGDREILSGVNADVERGELVAIMGPSGSGKTTILRAIAGLEPFQQGRITVEDVALEAGMAPAKEALRRLRRKVGMVFQFHHLFEHLTAIQNVCLAPVHAHGVPEDQARAQARTLLTAFGVEHRADALPRQLSGGEAQRVAIARALAVDPPILLMDEPTASLDPTRRTELGELVRRLTTEGRTLVIATHDEDFARAWATRILRLSAGALQAAEDRSLK
jgi:ABC-type polar amino acid transport system ATPase subunit